MRRPAVPLSVLAAVLLIPACGGEHHDAETHDTHETHAAGELVATVEGLAGPEAVRYDPDQDVYFVANFNGEAAGDSNGFISLVLADGTLERLRFATGTPRYPLHGPRGMYITADTLWVADAEGVHGFNRMTGEHVAFVRFTRFEPGFLNDIAQGPDGALYVTDTGRARVFRLMGRAITVALADSLLGPPNGITWDRANERFLIAAWGPGHVVRGWKPGTVELTDVGTVPAGRFDGIEVVGAGILVASQTDSSLHLIADGAQRPVIRVPGRPADIGVDTRRNRVAVPYIALDRVDIYRLP